MANVKSYAWSQRINEPVDDGGVITVPTPGFVDPASYKTDEAQFVLDGNVLTPEQATGAWAGDFSSVDVTNGVGGVWSPGQTLYVTVAGTPFDATSVEASFDALEARVTANEAAITALDGRVVALEAGTGAFATSDKFKREQGGILHGAEAGFSQEPKHKRKAEEPQDEEKAKPKAKPGEPHWNPSDIEAAEEDTRRGKKHK